MLNGKAGTVPNLILMVTGVSGMALPSKRKLPGSSAMYIVVEDEVHVDYSFSRNFLQILRL